MCMCVSFTDKISYFHKILVPISAVWDLQWTDCTAAFLNLSQTAPLELTSHKLFKSRRVVWKKFPLGGV